MPKAELEDQVPHLIHTACNSLTFITKNLDGAVKYGEAGSSEVSDHCRRHRPCLRPWWMAAGVWQQVLRCRHGARKSF